MMPKPKARIITTAWGESYLSELLDITVPALLAPGNLPAFAELFETEFVLVTERREFAFVEVHPAYQMIKRICPARLIMADDLVVSRNMYGTSLTHCLHRGFEDLGPDMTEHYLLFLNSDFVLADGSYATLARKLLAGERLVFAPSYCANSEPVLPQLRARIDPAKYSLTMPPREMASIILQHRHNTIRSKTVNVPVFHMNISDQFYWYVDESTLLGHQMPIALVAMRPERPYIDPVSFWDYATISMAAPNLPRCVLGDSDDFLMLELRRSRTFVELMRIGRVATKDVASALGYMTIDQYEMGRFALTLHSRDLPPQTEVERANLRAHLDKVYEALPPPTPYVDHPLWTNLIEEFRRVRREWWEQNGPRKIVDDGGASDEVDDAAYAVPPSAPPGLILRVLQKLFPEERVRAFYRRIYGTLPRVSRNHPYWACLRFVIGEIDRVAAVPASRILVVRSEDGFLHRAVEAIPDARVWVVSPYTLRSRGLPEGALDLDLCLFDLDWHAANHMFQKLYAEVRPGMRDRGRIVLHHASSSLREMTDRDVGKLLPFLPSSDLPSVSFSGGSRLALAIDSYVRMLELRARGMRLGRLLLPWRMLKVLVRARRGNAAAENLPPHEVPRKCCSITVTTEVIRPHGSAESPKAPALSGSP